jgi:MscS family membrane protein
MRLKFETVFRGYVILLVLVLFWSVWASAADSSTNTLERATSNAPSLLPGLKTLNEDSLTFGLNQWALLRDHTLFGEPLWKYLASLIYVLLAFYVSRFVDYLTSVWLKRLAAKTETKFDDLLLELAHGPIKVVTLVLLLYVGLGIFRWPPAAQLVLAKGFIIVVACSITYMVLKLVDLLLSLWRRRAGKEEDKEFDQLLFPIIRKSLKAFVALVAVLMTSQNLGINITGLIASLSIGGLALGLAAQDTLANLFGAVAVLVDKPFRIGDRIKLEAVDGMVESIGLRSTRVRNLDGHLITIPNKTMGNATITNVTLRPHIKTEMNLGITYDTPVEKVQLALKTLEEIFRRHPMTEDVLISFNKFADSALNITVVHWWRGTDYRAYLAGMQELNLAIKQRFDAAGIEFAFPSQTHYVKHVDK